LLWGAFRHAGTDVKSLVLCLSHKEVEEVVASREIIIEGVAINAIKTVGIDGEWKE